MEKENDEGIISKYNAGMLGMLRLHDLLRDINFAHTNLLSWNNESNCWMFEFLFNRLNSLFHEASSKLSTLELVNGKMIREVIRKRLKYYPIYERLTDPDKKEDKLKLNNDNWEVFEELITLYENEIRSYLEKHKLNAPAEDMSSLF